MKEELYVFVENECYQLDLPKPSGITLKWESILFKDISSLVCSHSYTFKIPMTRNNTTAFNMVEDIRHETSTREKTFKAEFYINGVNICPNAKLYISEIGDSVYSCVMTWNVLEAFQKMKSDSLKLNELPSIGEITWKSGDANLVYGEPVTNLSNKASVLYPAYDAGLPYENGVPPKPVVPIMRILDLINDYYGVNIKIGQEQNSLLGLIPLENFNNPNYHGSKVYDDYITQGCIPLTGIGISSQEEFEIDNLSLIRNIYFCTGSYTRQGRTIQWRRVSDGSYFYADHDMISQDNVTVTADNRIYIYYNVATITIFKKNKYVQWVPIETKRIIKSESGEIIENWGTTYGYGNGTEHVYGRMCNYTCECEDIIVVKEDHVSAYGFDYASNYYNKYGHICFRLLTEAKVFGKAEVHVKKEAINAGRVALDEYRWIYLLEVGAERDNGCDISIVSDKSEDWIGLRSISRYETASEWVYLYDFGVEYLQRALSLDSNGDNIGYMFWAGISGSGTDYQVGEIANSNDVYFQKLEITSIKPQITYEGIPCKMDIVRNLPDISCFDFVKAIFYMNGSMPKVGTDGKTITAMYYSQIRDRVLDNEGIDWSSKMIGNDDQNSSSIKFKNTNFAKSNYFDMSYKTRDKSKEELAEELEIYDTGYGNITINDENLNEEKSVYTSPFYPPLIKDIGFPNVKVGKTLKIWNGDRTINMGAVNPIYGVLNYRALNEDYEDITDESSRPVISEQGVNYKHVRMNAYNPFARIDGIYGYLQNILSNYTAIKEKFILDEFDLLNFDESMPIYLQKYNAFFAVLSIQRDKEGISTCELIKLPRVPVEYPERQITGFDDSVWEFERIEGTVRYDSNASYGKKWSYDGVLHPTITLEDGSSFVDDDIRRYTCDFTWDSENGFIHPKAPVHVDCGTSPMESAYLGEYSYVKGSIHFYENMAYYSPEYTATIVERDQKGQRRRRSVDSISIIGSSYVGQTQYLYNQNYGATITGNVQFRIVDAEYNIDLTLTFPLTVILPRLKN